MKPCIGYRATEIFLNQTLSYSLDLPEQGLLDDPETVIEYLRHGKYYAVEVPEILITEELKRGELIQVLPDWQCRSEEVWIIRASKNYPSELLRDLEKFISRKWHEEFC